MQLEVGDIVVVTDHSETWDGHTGVLVQIEETPYYGDEGYVRLFTVPTTPSPDERIDLKYQLQHLDTDRTRWYAVNELEEV